jgi:hypothetical protein
MSLRKEALERLAAGLRMAADAAADLARGSGRSHRSFEIPRVEIDRGELTQLDRARARAAARRRGLKVIRDPEDES